MKDCSVERYVKSLESMRDQRNKVMRAGKPNYMDGLRYCHDIHNILHFLWLTGSIDYGEFKKMEHRFRVSGKDMRKYVYCADFVSDELKGRSVSLEFE